MTVVHSEIARQYWENVFHDGFSKRLANQARKKGHIIDIG